MLWVFPLASTCITNGGLGSSSCAAGMLTRCTVVCVWISDVVCAVGRYSALCFAGAISFEDGVRITKARGEAMQVCVHACVCASSVRGRV